ncbi:bifunctional phosphoribosylaminoimidazole carboxylase/phosphoribosylaminoimidazole succinocarboxamide synthetase [Pelodytes ibericus]
MERGAGRYWTEDEIQALLSVWSEKNIKRQLHGTLRNKGLFMYIAKRMQQLGVFRDWKQCRAKYKNLKYEYRAIKCGNTGDASKLRFYDKLDAILGSETAAELAEDEEDNLTLETDMHLDRIIPAPRLEALSGDRKQGDIENSHVMIPAVSNEGGKHWTAREIRALINIWSDKNIRWQLKGMVRNQGIFEHIARLLQQAGIDRDWRQCRTKYKNLKHEYVVVKKAIESGNKTKTMKYFNELDAILSSKPTGHRKSLSSTDRPASLFCASSSASKGLPRSSLGAEGGKHWTTEEIKALITVWYDCEIRKQLEGTVRNRKIFEHIARLLQNLGVERDWRQCRTKYKNLKHEYIVTKRALESGDTSKTMKFFYVLDDIMQNKVSELSSQSDTEKTEAMVIRVASISDIRVEDACTESIQESSMVNEEHTAENLRTENTYTDDDDSLSNLSEAGSTHHVKKEVEGFGVNTELQEDVDNDFKIVTVNDSGAGRNWSDHEVRSLLNVWSDERICRQLEGTFRNRELFEEISQRMMEFGVNRDWKQCRTKYKNLKYEYYAIRNNGAQQSLVAKSMKFYDEIDNIIQMPKISAVEGREVKNGISFGNDCREQTSVDYNLPQRITADESVAEITEDRVRGAGIKRKAPPTELQVADKRKNSGRAGAQDKTHSGPTIRQSVDTSHHVCWNPSQGDQPSQGFSSQWHNITFLIRSHVIKSSSIQLRLGKKLNEGKTKEVYELLDHQGCVLMLSKDQITAGNAARKDHMEGKAHISNKTTSCVFKLLQEAGIKTAFVKKCSGTGFIATHCEMIPIEWVCRRIATGSFLKRNPGVKEGYRFSPPKVELFFKDDANNDPQWSEEQLIAAKLNFAGLLIGQAEVDIMNHSTVAIFEILEKAWLTQDCTLVDMKIEFGVDVTKKEIVLADVIDNDSWRLWPSGDKTQQKDKQTYRDLKEITPEAMQMVKRNFEWVADKVELLNTSVSHGRVVVLMGSISDLAHCEKIKNACANYGIPCELRVTSAHKGPDETLRIKSEYEGDGIPTVFVAVAGRSNGLGPVLSGNTAYPVINCPPLTPDWGAQDVWSSLRMPSGLGCSTVLSPEAAAQFAAQIFGLNNHLVWSKLRSCTLNTWISLKQADAKLRACSI